MSPALAAILARPIAHRGLHRAGGPVENSYAAAEAAVAAGFGIECDVQGTADGEAVVFHDETLERLTAAAGRVDAWPASALARLALSGGGDTVATLPALLDRIAGRAPLVIEIKSRGDGDECLAARTVAAVATYCGPVALKSFDPRIVAACRRLGAACPLGLVGPTEDGESPLDDCAPDFLSWNIDRLADRPTAGVRLPAMTWTIRSRADHARATRAGAQIVFEAYRPDRRKP